MLVLRDYKTPIKLDDYTFGWVSGKAQTSADLAHTSLVMFLVQDESLKELDAGHRVAG